MSLIESSATHSAGFPEVSVEFVNSTLGKFRLIDCREAHELTGPLGAIADVEHVPMAQIPQAVGGWTKDEDIVVLCRSGARSGRATQFLLGQGFQHVASMAGGMIDWNQHGFPNA